jgi:hypothetical protein
MMDALSGDQCGLLSSKVDLMNFLYVDLRTYMRKRLKNYMINKNK